MDVFLEQIISFFVFGSQSEDSFRKCVVLLCTEVGGRRNPTLLGRAQNKFLDSLLRNIFCSQKEIL